MLSRQDNESPTPKQPRYAVVLACDLGYAPYAFFLADSLRKLEGKELYDIVILSQDDLPIPGALERQCVSVVRVPPRTPFDDAPNIDRHGLEAFFRLLAPDLLKRHYDRILYLDVDIIPNAKLSQLFDANLSGAAIAAVRDHQQWRTARRQVDEFRKMKLRRSGYFNSGVVLLDVCKFLEADVINRSKKLMSDAPDALIRHDQSILNILFYESWTEISPIWNWQYTAATRFFADLVEPRLFHFIGGRKPWRDKKSTLPARFRKAYYDFSEAHYPDQTHTIAPVDPMAMAWPENPVGAFLKHARSVATTRRYLSRFPEELTAYGPIRV
jgi:lipopolysaccharide biosynthesis glycosyltransferase